MAKGKRNKALAVLDGRIEIARMAEVETYQAYQAAAQATKQLMAAREQVAKAYERPVKSAKPDKSSKARREVVESFNKQVAEVAAGVRRKMDTPEGLGDNPVP